MPQSPYHFNRPPEFLYVSRELLEGIAVDLERAGIIAPPEVLLRHIQRRNLVSRSIRQVAEGAPHADR